MLNKSEGERESGAVGRERGGEIFLIEREIIRQSQVTYPNLETGLSKVLVSFEVLVLNFLSFSLF